MKQLKSAVPALTIILAACGTPAAQTPANGTANANLATPAAGNTTASASTGALSPYVGRLPSDDVAGATFVANPLVRSAVEAAVPDAEVRRWVLRGDVTSNPIVMREGRLFASGCESHNCGRHWTIQIDPAGTAAEVCYSTDGSASQHYTAGRAAQRRDGLCPRSDGQ